MRKKLITLLSVGLLLAAWQIGALRMDQPAFVPSLADLGQTLFRLLMTFSFYRSFLATVVRGLEGMMISLAIASVMAWLFARYEFIYELFRPVLAMMRSVPVISFILLALIFLHPENIPLLIAFLTMFPLLTENLTKGISSLHPGFREVGRQFRISGWNRLTQIVYPQLKPFLFSGLASAMGFGWRAIIMGEVLAQCSLGIGSEMKKAQNFIEVPTLLAWTLVAIGISFIFDKGIYRMAAYQRKIAFAARPAKDASQTFRSSAVQLENIGYIYGIHSFTYTFSPGKIYGISAPSGTGKTTLLRLINGSLLPLEGKLQIDRRKGIASVFQEPELLPHLTVIENIMLPLARLYPEHEAKLRAHRYLEEMEMDTFALRYPSELSYGQQQRVSLARAWAFPSPFLLMDEPFKGLDEALRDRLIERMRRIQHARNQTVLFTSHHPEELKRLSDAIIYLTGLTGDDAKQAESSGREISEL